MKVYPNGIWEAYLGKYIPTVFGKPGYKSKRSVSLKTKQQQKPNHRAGGGRN